MKMGHYTSIKVRNVSNIVLDGAIGLFSGRLDMYTHEINITSAFLWAEGPKGSRVRHFARGTSEELHTTGFARRGETLRAKPEVSRSTGVALVFIILIE